MGPTSTQGRSTARLIASFSVVGVLFLGACGAAGPSRTPASLRVIAVPDNARIDIDERFAGSARVLALRPKQLRAGSHRVTVSAPGYFPHDLMLDLPSGETKIEISLRPIP